MRYHITTNLVTQNDRNAFSYNSGGPKSETSISGPKPRYPLKKKVSLGLYSMEDVYLASPSFWWLLAFLALWPHPQSLPLDTLPPPLPSVSNVPQPATTKDTWDCTAYRTRWIICHLKTLNFVTSAKTHLPDKFPVIRTECLWGPSLSLVHVETALKCPVVATAFLLWPWNPLLEKRLTQPREP